MGGSAQRRQFGLFKPRQPPRRHVEGRAQFGRVVLRNQLGIGAHRVQPALRAQVAVPAVASGHMADFFFQDDVQDFACGMVACAHQFVLGPKAPEIWRELDLASHRVVGKVSDRLTRDGIGSNVLGDPRVALTWLANELSHIGVTLAAGQVVTTGTCVVPLEIQAQDTVSIDFGVLGHVSCRMTNA